MKFARFSPYTLTLVRPSDITCKMHACMQPNYLKHGNFRHLVYTVVILNNATTLMHTSTLSTNNFGNNHFGQKYQKQKILKIFRKL